MIKVNAWIRLQEYLLPKINPLLFFGAMGRYINLLQIHLHLMQIMNVGVGGGVWLSITFMKTVKINYLCKHNYKNSKTFLWALGSQYTPPDGNM